MTGPATEDAPSFRLEGVRLACGAFTLRIPRLNIASNERLCLVGPTGSGKSTLLRVLAGLESPDEGAVRFAEQPLDRPHVPLQAARRITMVFQRPLLLRGSVRSSVEFGLRLRRLGPCRDRVDRALAQLGLTDLAGQSTQTLSAGQTQLVAVARALVIEPDVLILDEATANLDPARVALVESVVSDDHLRRGTTVVWATHNLFQARRVSDRVGLLLGGQLVEVVPTERFFDAPSDERTGAFVRGEMVY